VTGTSVVRAGGGAHTTATDGGGVVTQNGTTNSGGGGGSGTDLVNSGAGGSGVVFLRQPAGTKLPTLSSGATRVYFSTNYIVIEFIATGTAVW
jgi:hypothetical protein